MWNETNSNEKNGNNLCFERLREWHETKFQCKFMCPFVILIDSKGHYVINS